MHAGHGDGGDAGVRGRVPAVTGRTRGRPAPQYTSEES
ncbi:hypothetical protein SLNWT_6944 [Streptomyces albus]|uniref:Uncharacterized protein n=1 Tax=Streptomyces albus (strain ATCC 21838 / DSM 41398 / FERM P-419 / JCM 4703 / NBRC 107858) TaxID=1081613 RepID=A0A0B5F6Z6_STRA4|nr:hypothetical protein SLNWT_6944 [Streptomyces albus]AOU81623.1 hypothetical protein SLNHY_6932 [Streptomyces albus]